MRFPLDTCYMPRREDTFAQLTRVEYQVDSKMRSVNARSRLSSFLAWRLCFFFFFTGVGESYYCEVGSGLGL